MANFLILNVCALLILANAGVIISDTLLDSRTIVGGFPIEIHEAPYQVSLQINESHGCGGSIISSSWILTAAHCIEDGIESLSVRLGSTKHAAGGEVKKIAKTVCHPYYVLANHFSYDFCLLKLESRIKLSNTIQTIKLADKEPRTGSFALVSGWGDTRSSTESNDVLRAAYVPIISREDCNKAYNGVIDNSMICAGLWEGGRDSCKADSGGPLVFDGLLVGVVSWGEGCGEARYPGVYGSVAAVLDWIKETTN
ncbi:trypsin-1-like [Uranotaenia lowii]|uniref:trypsin-1-like n=1 Tax=Uranotaenia lowii TaxID=190385 RepID=UPI002479EC19|nr:trypsin-1-like [Uranotaenia lowii]